MGALGLLSNLPKVMQLGKKRYTVFPQTKDREKLRSCLALGSFIARGGDASFVLGESRKSFDSPMADGSLLQPHAAGIPAAAGGGDGAS